MDTMEHIAPAEVAAEPSVAGPEMTPVPPKKSRKKLLMILIPVLVVVIAAGILLGITIHRKNLYEDALALIEDGDLEEAIAIHEKLGDYKDLNKELSDAIAKQFKSYMKKGSYKKAAKTYALSESYPDSTSAMNKTLESYMEDFLEDYEHSTAVEVYDRLIDYPGAVEAMNEAIEDYVEDLYYDLLTLHDLFAEEDISVISIDQRLGELTVYYIADQHWFYDAFNCYTRIDDAAVLEELNADLADATTQVLEYSIYYYDELCYAMDSYELEIEAISEAAFDYACTCMDNENYSSAYELFETLAYQSYAGAEEKLEEVDLLLACQRITEYLEYGWYYDARSLMQNYSGDAYEQLYAIYLSYCADATFLTDLMAALEARWDAEANGESYYNILDDEWDALYEYYYEYIPFGDETLKALAMDYISAVYDQWEVTWYYSESSDWFLYKYQMAEAVRYQALKALHDAYGFGEGNAELVEDMENADARYTYYSIAYEIHYMMTEDNYVLDSWYWYDDDTIYCDAYNYSDYTFSFRVNMTVTDWYDSILLEGSTEVYDFAPGEYTELYMELDISDWWNVEFTLEILEIYDSDGNLIPNP